MRACKNCGATGDINYEGLCIDCASSRTEEQRALEKQPPPPPGTSEYSILYMTQVMAKMDMQISHLNRIAFWVSFWSILGLIVFALNILLTLLGGSRIF